MMRDRPKDGSPYFVTHKPYMPHPKIALVLLLAFGGFLILRAINAVVSGSVGRNKQTSEAVTADSDPARFYLVVAGLLIGGGLQL